MHEAHPMALGEGPPFLPITTDHYHQILAQGIVPAGAPVELIDGLLVCKDRSRIGQSITSHDPEHAIAVRRLQRLEPRLPQGKCFVRTQLPITIPPHHEPEPDAAVVCGTDDAFTLRHPGPDDLLAVIEASHSSLRFDRTTKQRLYATARIPLYWIVNLVERLVEVYSDPDPARGEYRTRRDFRPGQQVLLPVGDGHEIEINVSDLLSQVETVYS